MNVVRLFLINALFTLAGGVILVLAPGQLLQLVGVHLDPDAYFVCYLLGASSVSFAVLSLFGMALKDAEAIRAVTSTFLVFHASSAGVAAYALGHGLSAAAWANVLVHVGFALLFAYYGLLTLHTGQGPMDSQETLVATHYVSS